MKRYILILYFLSHILSIFSQEWISFAESEAVQKPFIDIMSSNSEEFIFSIKIFGFITEKVEIEDRLYDKIQLPGYKTLNDVGFPSLPTINELIGIPKNSTVKLSILDSSWTKISGYNIMPYQESLLETERRVNYDINEDFYASSRKYPDNICRVSEIMHWREIENLNLMICPFMYYPQNHTLEVMTEFTVKIKFDKRTTNEKIDINKCSSDFNCLLKHHLLNYNAGLIETYFDQSDIVLLQKDQEKSFVTKSTKTSGDYNYLIISDPTYFNSKPLMAFKDWKSRSGLKCEMVSTLTTGTSSTSIKNYIEGEYNNHGIEYVLFVGEHENIPSFPWGQNHSDYIYGCLDGYDDFQAEVSIGRFSINTLSQLENIVEKTLHYEEDPPVNNWFEKSLLIAHKEEAPENFQGCKEDIRTNSYSVSTPVFDCAYGAHSAQGGNDANNQTIIDAINEGRGLINYRGHGVVTGWNNEWCYNDDDFDTDEVSCLSNDSETPVIFSIACLTGKLNDSNDCLLETFTRGSNGAVAYLGASRETYTEVNNTLDNKLYEQIFDHGIYNIGYVLIGANNETMSIHNDIDSTKAKINTYSYLWGGDPSLEIRTNTPVQLSNVSIVDFGSGGVSIIVSGASNCDIILSSSLDDGDSYFEFIEGVTYGYFPYVTRPYYVTVKRHNFVPYLSDTYIQNKTLNSDSYITGNNIVIGSEVTSGEPSGPVLIENGANIMLDATDNVIIEGVFEAEAGSNFEVIK